MQSNRPSAAPLSAPCLGYHATSGSIEKVPEMGAQASAPCQLRPRRGSPPSVSRPAGPDAAAPREAVQAARQPDLDGYMQEQQPAQLGRSAEPPRHAGRQQAEAAPQWCCTRCRQLLPEGDSGPEACTCERAPPAKRLNTGSSGRLHSRMEALNDGQMEKLLDLAQELGLLPVSSSASGGQPSWIPRLAASSPSPKLFLQPGAAQPSVPGQVWPSGSASQPQPAGPPTLMQAADLRLRRAAASRQAAAAQGNRTAEQLLAQQQQHQHQPTPAMLPQGQPQPQLEHPSAPQQQQQQQQQYRQPFEQHMLLRPEEQVQRPDSQGQGGQQHQMDQQQEVLRQLRQMQERQQGQPSPRTPVGQRLPAPTDLPALAALHGATTAQHAQLQPLPPRMLPTAHSLPVPLPAQRAMLPRFPSEPLPDQHQQPRLRPYQPHKEARPQQVQAEGMPMHPHPAVGHQLSATLPQQQFAVPQRPPAEQHTPARGQQEQAQQEPPPQRRQQQQQRRRRRQQKEPKQQATPAKRRPSQQAQHPTEGSASAQCAAEPDGGPARGPAAGPLAKAWQRLLEQQATELTSWQQEQRRLLMEAHEQQAKQLRVAHQVQLLQLERAHLLGLSRHKSEPLPPSPATAPTRLPLGQQHRHSPAPPAQQQQQQDGAAQTAGQGGQQQRWGEVASFLRRVQSQHTPR